MPCRIIVAAESCHLMKAICSILQLLTVSCVITLSTTASEDVLEHLNRHDAHLLILGYNKAHARSLIHSARTLRPQLRTLWLGRDDETLSEADSTLQSPYNTLRVAHALSSAVQ